FAHLADWLDLERPVFGYRLQSLDQWLLKRRGHAGPDFNHQVARRAPHLRVEILPPEEKTFRPGVFTLFAKFRDDADDAARARPIRFESGVVAFRPLQCFADRIRVAEDVAGKLFGDDERAILRAVIFLAEPAASCDRQSHHPIVIVRNSIDLEHDLIPTIADP